MGRMGQFSMEYMIVIAFGIMAIITIAFVIFSEFGRQTEEINTAELSKFGNTIADAVSRVSYLGESSVLTMNPIMPAGIINISVENNKTLVIKYRTGDGDSELPFRMAVPITVDFGSLNKGTKKIVVRDRVSYISVCSQDDSRRCNNKCDVGYGEDALNTPSDCCTPECHSCDADGSYMSCTSDVVCYSTCYGHNGCSELC